MADEITAVFHYRKDGEEATVSETYSVARYIEDYTAKAGEEPATYGGLLPLVKALADYGHYAQLFLAERNGWTIGEDYAAMETFFTKGGYSDAETANALAALSDQGAVVAKNGDITGISVSLALDSETAIRIYAKRAQSYKGGVTATLDGAEASAVKQKDGRYKVTVPNIGAHELGKRYEVALVTTNAPEPATVSISVLSYVKACLGKADLAEKERDAMMSLYRYYEEAQKVIS